MRRNTKELQSMLENCKELQDFYEEHSEDFLYSALPGELNKLVGQKGLKKSAVIATAQINEIYGYQIFAGKRRPERNKLLCLLIAMGADLNEVQTVLKHAGYAQLYVKNPVDCAVIYGICKHMTIPQINNFLFDHGLKSL